MNYQQKNLSEFNEWFDSLSKEELRQLFLKYKPFFNEYEMAFYLGMKVQDIGAIRNGSIYGMDRGYEKFKILANYVMYVPPMNEPNDPVGYRVAFRILSKCIMMKQLFNYYTLDYEAYKKFMRGDNKALNKKELHLIYKALRLRPLNKFG